MSNSIETRSTSALFKRAEQLRRWQESDTNREPNEPKRSRLMPYMTHTTHTTTNTTNTTNTQHPGSMRTKESGKKRGVRFMDGCVFLAACAAADKDEVEKLVERGADIDTANIDGLTALHQACIDDNLEMVEFLVQRGADVNRGDNEGWTPLHATASCGFISIARYLIDHGANVSAVNNDGELAIDIAESDDMEILLQKEIDARGIDCEESRNTEERLMLEDARQWLNSKQFKDQPHSKTGATALHVAAAKGYIKVMSLLIQGGATTNAQDLDGWTPLHAAAHWAQREACELLCENYSNMDIKNYVGQTCFDVADPDVIRLLEDLKKKQNTLQKDRPEIRNLINRPAIPAGSSPISTGKRRSSITRLSIDDKALRSKEVSSQERDLLLNKSPLVSETIPEIQRPSDSDKESSADSDPGKKSPDDSFNDDSDLSESEKIHAQTKAGLKAVSKRNRSVLDSNTSSKTGVPRITLSKEDGVKSSSINDISKKTTDPANADTNDVYPWRRPASLRARPTTTTSSVTSKLSPSKEEEDVQLRRAHSFESDEKFYARLTELRNRIRATSMPILPDQNEAVKVTPRSQRSRSTQDRVNNNNSNNNSQAATVESKSISSNPKYQSNKSVSDNKTISSTTVHSLSSVPAYYSSLPRNPVRHLPSLPENSTAGSTPFKAPLAPVSSLKYTTPTPVSPPPLVRSLSLKDNSLPTLDEGLLIRKSPDNSRRRPASSTSTPLITDLVNQEGVGCADMETSNKTIPEPQNPTKLELWKRREDQFARPKSDTNLQPHQVRRSFVPPVRDEESETQRKAHAKRVRETRRSTQGVTLEDLKSAEQLVKKNKQQEQQQRTSELQQLAATTAPSSMPLGSTATTTVSTAMTKTTSSATAASDQERTQERRPSWRLKVEGGSDRNRFRLEDSRSSGDNDGLAALRKPSAGKGPPNPTVPSISLTDERGFNSPAATSGHSPKPAIQRRKKPKRRSTGVVKLGEVDDDKDEDDSESEEEDVGGIATGANNWGTSLGTDGARQSGSSLSSSASKANTSQSQNGADVDYKKLWEESQKENGRLREDMDKVKNDLTHTKRQLDGAKQAGTASSSAGGVGLTDAERREKKALERKLSEMEEELKQLQKLKAENERLKSENRALTRVVSKLTTAAGAVLPPKSTGGSGGGRGSSGPI